MKKTVLILLITSIIVTMFAGCSSRASDSETSTENHSGQSSAPESSVEPDADTEDPSGEQSMDTVLEDAISEEASLEEALKEQYHRIYFATPGSSGMVAISVEIPDSWTFDAQTGYMYPISQDEQVPLSLYYHFEISDDQEYSQDFFNMTATEEELQIQKLAGPTINQHVFSLKDGTPVYFSSEGAAGSTYCEYAFLKGSSIVKMKYRLVQLGAVDNPEGLNIEGSQDQLIRILDSFQFK